MEQFVLQMQQIYKSFAGVKALKGVDFYLKKGEIHAIVGENGAGKSTLMNILGGIHTPDAGVIKIDGRNVKFNSPADAQKCGVTFIHQELSVFPDLDIVSNIFIERYAISGKLSLVDYRYFLEETKKILKKFKLEINPRTKVRYLSIGQQQMIEIARIFTRNTKILVLDEPTSSLTESEVEILFDIITALKKEGVSIIYISHKMDEIFRICDRITVLRDGNYIMTADTSEITLDSLLGAMIGKGLNRKFPDQKHSPGAEIIFEVKNLCWDSKLKNISFSLKKGEVFGLAGLLGSGRTELARVIFGLEKRAKGEMFLEGKHLQIKSPKDAIRVGIGFLTENRRDEGLMLEKPILDNMVIGSLEKFVANKLFIKQKECKNSAIEYIQNLGIKCRNYNQKVKFLSGGNQQKVVLAKWLLTDPKLLILDEPTRGIDVGAKFEVYKLIDDLAAKGVSIIVISSEIDELLGICDRLAVMRKGKLVSIFDTKSVDQHAIASISQGGTYNGI